MKFDLRAFPLRRTLGVTLLLSLNSFIMRKIIFLLTLVLSFAVQAGLLFSYNRLALKDLDQMNKLIVEKIKESRKERGDKTMPLKEALQAVFSRPNEDFLIEKVLPPLRNELEEHGAWEKTVKSLVKESLGALENAQAFKPQAQVTYAIFLENLVAELRPKVAEDFERSILMQIREAKLELTKEANSERRLRMMKEGTSPSALAKAVLETYELGQKNDLVTSEKTLGKEKTEKIIDKNDAKSTGDSGEKPAPSAEKSEKSEKAEKK